MLENPLVRVALRRRRVNEDRSPRVAGGGRAGG